MGRPPPRNPFSSSPRGNTSHRNLPRAHVHSSSKATHRIISGACFVLLLGGIAASVLAISGILSGHQQLQHHKDTSQTNGLAQIVPPIRISIEDPPLEMKKLALRAGGVRGQSKHAGGSSSTSTSTSTISTTSSQQRDAEQPSLSLSLTSLTSSTSKNENVRPQDAVESQALHQNGNDTGESQEEEGDATLKNNSINSELQNASSVESFGRDEGDLHPAAETVSKPVSTNITKNDNNVPSKVLDDEEPSVLVRIDNDNILQKIELSKMKNLANNEPSTKIHKHALKENASQDVPSLLSNNEATVPHEPAIQSNVTSSFIETGANSSLVRILPSKRPKKVIKKETG